MKGKISVRALEMNIIIRTINLTNGWASFIEGVWTSVFNMIKCTFLARTRCNRKAFVLSSRDHKSDCWKCHSQFWPVVQAGAKMDMLSLLPWVTSTHHWCSWAHICGRIWIEIFFQLYDVVKCCMIFIKIQMFSSNISGHHPL